MGPYLTLILFLALVIFIIRILVDLASTPNFNAFLDKWTLKTVWLWLPFYALPRLIKEVILKNK